MRIVSYRYRGESRLGVLSTDQASLVDFSDVSPDLPSDLSSCLAFGPSIWSAIERKVAKVSSKAWIGTGSIEFLPPVQRPGKIICLGLNYADHAAEGGHAKPEYPSLFLRSSTSLVGHLGAIVLPIVSTKLDFEAELALIVGRRSRHLTGGDALSSVAGYSCFNDATLRDYQKRTSQWTIGKNFDSTGAFGPSFVPAGNLPPGATGLRIESRLNGRVMQSDNTSNMLFSVKETLCLLTEALTLEVGDVVVMGTPAGVGYARRPPVWMSAGDRIEIEVEGIGVLLNTVKQESASTG